MQLKKIRNRRFEYARQYNLKICWDLIKKESTYLEKNYRKLKTTEEKKKYLRQWCNSVQSAIISRKIKKNSRHYNLIRDFRNRANGKLGFNAALNAMQCSLATTKYA